MEKQTEETKQEQSRQKTQNGHEIAKLERNPHWEFEKIRAQIEALRRR
jgi:hypothetical protein